MTRILHVLTRPPSETASSVMERQQKNPGNEVKVMRLPEASANYEELLQAIFEADSVAIW